MYGPNLIRWGQFCGSAVNVPIVASERQVAVLVEMLGR